MPRGVNTPPKVVTCLTPEPTPPNDARPEMQPRTPRLAGKKKHTRKPALIFGSIAVAALLLGAGFWLAFPTPTNASSNEGTLSQPHLSTPDAVLAEAHRVLPTYAATEDAALEAVTAAQGAVETAARTAQSEVINAALEQSTVLQSTVQQSTGLGLPNVPTQYVLGQDVNAFVGATGSLPYTVESLDVPGTLGGATSLADTTVGGTFATGSSAPRTGIAEIDGLVNQVGVLDSIYETVAGQGLDSTLAGLGQGLPVPVPAGLPTDGLIPGSPSTDTGAVNPDDEGALNALEFGYGLTDGVTGAFAQLSDQANTILADQEALIAQVDALAFEVRTLESDAAADIQSELNARIATAGNDAQARIVALEEAKAQFEQLLLDTHTEATSALLADLEASQAQLEALANAQVEGLESTAAQLQTEADARIADLDAQTDAYMAILAGMQLEGMDVTDQAVALQAEADAVRGAILAQATSQQEYVLSAAADLDAQANELLSGVQIPEYADLDAQLQSALSEADRALVFGQALAQATAIATVSADTAKADETIAAVHALADGKVEQIRGQALAYLELTTELAADGETLVGQLQTDGTTHLDAAVGYVEKVAEDYATIPEPERQATAEALLEDAKLLLGVGTGAVSSGSMVLAQFDDISSQATALQGQVSALNL